MPLIPKVVCLFLRVCGFRSLCGEEAGELSGLEFAGSNWAIKTNSQSENAKFDIPNQD